MEIDDRRVADDDCIFDCFELSVVDCFILFFPNSTEVFGEPRRKIFLDFLSLIENMDEND